MIFNILLILVLTINVVVVIVFYFYMTEERDNLLHRIDALEGYSEIREEHIIKLAEWNRIFVEKLEREV